MLRCTRACASSEDFPDKAGANKEATEPWVGSNTVEVFTSKVSQSLLCLVNSYTMSVSHGTMDMFRLSTALYCLLFVLSQSRPSVLVRSLSPDFEHE